jgi:CHAT domain-containing protein
LPYTIEGLQHIGDHIRGQKPGAFVPITYLIDQKATRTNLLEQSRQAKLRNYQTIHIASHAFLVPDRGLLAHIKLYDDDVLMDEVAQLDLDGCLVILSVCHGAAASEVLPGEEILSLSRAFLVAGARCVIASLWHVYDLAVRNVMLLLYEGLHQGLDAAQALARAQRMMQKQYIPGADETIPYSPLVWGGFLVLGAGS